LKQLLTIELLGQSYSFEADEDYEKAREIADFLVKEVQRVEARQTSGAGGVNKMAILILAALNIANENLELKRKEARIYRSITTRANDLLQRLDASAHAGMNSSVPFECGKP
jgi:cell division protein ZapA (FtsZ GTPase activity inhibitor)